MPMRKIALNFYGVIVIARDVYRSAVRERMMYGFLLLALLFILMANVPFMVGDPRVFENQAPETAALEIGFVAINIFTLLIAVFVSLGTLQSFLSRERLIFLLTKPVRRWQIMEGLLLGLIEMVFLNWCLMTAGLWLVVVSQTKSFGFYVWSGLGVTALLGVLYVILIVFFYTLIPNAIAGVLTILIFIAGFGASMAQQIIAQKISQPFLKTAVLFGLGLLPKINALFGLSMRELGLFDINIRPTPLLGHTFLVIGGINVLACLRFRRFGRT